MSTDKQYQCTVCNYIYNPRFGDPATGVPAGTSFEDIFSQWKCPVCGAPKVLFKEVN